MRIDTPGFTFARDYGAAFTWIGVSQSRPVQPSGKVTTTVVALPGGIYVPDAAR